MLLVTGYEPFGDHETNPSAEVARELDGAAVDGHDVAGEVLPVEFGAVEEAVADLLSAHDADALVGTGLAAGRAAVSVERVGINVDDCVGVPDNDGAEPRDARIDPEGPAAHFATLPVADAVARAQERGVPARLSNAAGTHCCNHLLYATRRHVEREDIDIPVGFVHLPQLPAEAIRQAEEAVHGGGVDPSMPRPLQVEGVRAVLSATADAL
jgi:pyroglutamyl-peptidase